jgi:hypothetical protein
VRQRVSLMCPLCIGTAAWLASGGTTAAGGIAAWIMKRRKPRKTARPINPDTDHYKQLQMQMAPHGGFCDHRQE